jgi:hypothetical protein
MTHLHMMRQPKQTGWRIAYRFLSGRPLDGVARTDCGYLRPGKRALTLHGHASRWAMLPGWKRQVLRLGSPVATVTLVQTYLAHPGPFTATVLATTSVVAGRAIRRARARWRMRRFHAAYVEPTLAALRPALGQAPVRLQVSPELGDLVPRLANPMSPAEKAVRAWYGQHVEPVLRWLPDHTMRGLWALQRKMQPVTIWLDRLRVPRNDVGPRITLALGVPFVTAEQRQYISAVISAKIPASDLVERWDQVGPKVSASWTVRRRPPSKVGYADLDARLPHLKEWEFFLGLGAAGKPVIISLKDDSPHIACSAGSGAGKSVLAQAFAVQVLARGGQVVILDRKGSHRWALGLAGVTYCTTVEQMHHALIALDQLAETRNAQALDRPEDWDPGPRVFVIAEELNATFYKLRDWWEDNKPKGGKKTSPAVRAFRNLLFMGRSAKVNVFAVAQMLTAHTTGGSESRENFAVRALARYTKNNWQMLAPEAGMPRASRTLGRWQIVVAGTVTECQVVYLSAAEARLCVHKHTPLSPTTQTPLISVSQEMSPRPGDNGDTTTAEIPADPLAEAITLRDAVDRGITPWAFDATKKRLQRARKANRPTAPVAVGRDGNADLYTLGDLVVWVESELVS